jgi:hypothetical protein
MGAAQTCHPAASDGDTRSAAGSHFFQQLVEEGQRLALGHADDALKTVDRFRHSAT